MNQQQMNSQGMQRNLSTADLAAAADPAVSQHAERGMNEQAAGRHALQGRPEDDQLAPLFSPDAANDFRTQWINVQTGFVDDPKQAVRRGDELVAQVMKSLAESFANERAKIEAQLDQRSDASTENLRLALRRYRSFFERLLSM